jgi:uncharacterized protein (DUF1684 family)
MWVIFGDLTNGDETYGMRYMYAGAIAPDTGVVVDGAVFNEGCSVDLDFNQSYTPPCGFTAFATCALPPRQNRLKVRIEAGEKAYGDATKHPP